MGFPNIFNRQASGFDANTLVSITDSGQHCLDQDQVKEINRYEILSSLEQHSPRSLSDLAKDTHLRITVVKNEITKMAAQKLVKASLGE